MALGASRVDVLRLVLLRGLWLTGIVLLTAQRAAIEALKLNEGKLAEKSTCSGPSRIICPC